VRKKFTQAYSEFGPKKTKFCKNLNFLSRVGLYFALSHNSQLKLHLPSTVPCLPLHQQIKHNPRKVGSFVGVGQ
jgi:hypothetical protein